MYEYSNVRQAGVNCMSSANINGGLQMLKQPWEFDSNPEGSFVSDGLM